MTVVVPEADLIQHLDFTPELPCEFRSCRQATPQPATHRYHGKTWCGCRHDYLACEQHAAQIRRVLHQVLSIWCEHCGAIRRGSRLCDWMRLEPLS